jgi:peptide/nickel transport system substrate-binding protein
MEKPLASYLSILAQTFILASHSFDGVADRNNAPIDAFPIGTGAFKFISRTPGDNITLAANHAYFGKGPYLEGVTYKYIPDATVIYTQFKAGDIDLVSQPWISPDNYREARALPGKIIEIIPSSTVECFAFNLGREPFQDPAVRQAIYYAVDKQSIIDVLNYGVPTATDSFVPQQSYYYNPALPKHVFDPARAREMLEETGWKLAADAIRARDGKRLAFTNTTTSGDRIREEMQQFLQQSLRDIGIDMQIQNMPAAVLFSDFWMKSRFHSILHGQDYMVGADPDASEFFLSGKSQAKGGDGMNFWQYGNAQVDRLLAQGASNLDPQARRPLYRKIQQLIRDDLPFLPLYQKARVAGFVSDLRGYQGNVNVRIDCWNIDVWKRGG